MIEQDPSGIDDFTLHFGQVSEEEQRKVKEKAAEFAEKVLILNLFIYFIYLFNT